MSESNSNDQPDITIMVPETQVAGVWANFAVVGHSPHEFTLDFVRVEFDGDAPKRGVVVSRISVSPLFITQLIDALQENWARYAQRALPQELRDNPPS